MITEHHTPDPAASAAVPADPLLRLRTALRSPLTWLLILVAYVLYSRMWNLADKVMHHDESLFAYYGYWLFKGNGYDYQPILHGPVLQFVSAFFFLLFGDDQWTMRLPSLLGGLLIFPVVWLWRRSIGGVAGAIAVTGLIAFSPSIAYYTRFLRNDVGYLTATMLCGYFLIRTMQTARPRYVWGALLSATLMFCMMESSIFFFAACIGYLVTMILVDLLICRRPAAAAAPPVESPAEPATAVAPLPDGHTQPEDPRAPDWPQWLRDDNTRWLARHRPGQPTIRGLDFFWCLLATIAITAAGGWLFYRVLYATIHIYKPVQGILGLVGIDLSPRAANWFIVICTLVAVYVLSLLVLSNVRRPLGRYGFLAWFSRATWLNRWHVIGAVAVAVFAYTTLFTTFFTYDNGYGWLKTASFDHHPAVRDFKGPVKSLTPVQIYKNTWDYWWDQHKLHRIKGPFHYYLPILFLYELPIIALAFLGWVRAVRNTRKPWLHWLILGAMHLALALLFWIYSTLGVKLGAPAINWEVLDKKFHISHPAHLFLILLYAQLLVYVSPLLYRQGRRAESFITYWGITNLFAYSYAGEKVPWLTIHTTGPLALLAAFELVRLSRRYFITRPTSPSLSAEPAAASAWRRRAFIAISILAVIYQARNNHLLLIQHPWSPAERLVYNHTSPDIHVTMDIVEDIAHKTNFGNKLPMLIQGEMGWPLHWYLRDYNNITAPVGENADNTTRPVVMVDWAMAGAPNLRQNYTIRRLKVREWWEPEMLNLSAMADIYLKLTPEETRIGGPMAERYRLALGEWRKLWHYMAYREIWIDESNSSWSNGTNEFALCIRKDIEERLMTYDWLAATPKRVDVPVFIPY